MSWGKLSLKLDNFLFKRWFKLIKIKCQPPPHPVGAATNHRRPPTATVSLPERHHLFLYKVSKIKYNKIHSSHVELWSRS